MRKEEVWCGPIQCIIALSSIISVFLHFCVISSYGGDCHGSNK